MKGGNKDNYNMEILRIEWTTLYTTTFETFVLGHEPGTAYNDFLDDSMYQDLETITYPFLALFSVYRTII
jgi:hypothetical protein